LAAIAVAAELGFAQDTIINGFAGFQGVKRRFTKTGEVSGITVIDDYAHHPKEISVTLNTAKNYVKETKGKVIAVVQPHRYTRVNDLFTDFCDCLQPADKILIADIYSAGEDPIAGIDKESMVMKIKENGHCDVSCLAFEQDLPKIISAVAKSGDLVLCMGAGSITVWANNLPGQLKELLS
jgi:UDP-N-acetylmuramate--alanine ligase